MRKKTHKIFSVVLTFCMVLSMFLGITVSADAADNVIDSVTITSIPTIESGASIADAKATFDVPEGCIAESHWYMWDASAYDGIGDWIEVQDGTFTDTDIYYLCTTFTTSEGYQFTEDWLDVKCPEGIEGDVWGEIDENDVVIYHCDMPKVSFATSVYKIDITIPEVKDGNVAELENIVIYSGDEIISNENFDIDAKWYCSTCDDEDVTGKTFEDGHAYYFELNVASHKGYYFSDTLQAFCNGEEDDFAFAATPTSYSYSCEYSLVAPLESIELSGLPEVKAGETMVDTLDIVSPLEDGEIYVSWWDEDGNDTTGETMKSGHIYTVQIEVYLSGYTPLSENFVYVIDGIEYEATSVEDNYSQAYLELEYDLSGGASAGDYDDTNTSDDANSDDEVINSDDTTIEDTETSANSSTPKTGDSSMILLWAVLAVMSMGTILVIRKKMY